MIRKKITHKLTLRLDTNEWLLIMELMKATNSKTASKSLLKAGKMYMYYKLMAWDLQNEIDIIKHNEKRS